LRPLVLFRVRCDGTLAPRDAAGAYDPGVRACCWMPGEP